MKKIISFILTAVMLLSMIPAFALSVSAEGATRTPLAVEFVSSTTNYHSNETTPKDLSIIFNPKNTTRTGLQSSTDVEVIGKLSEPTQITSFVVRSHYYRNRANGIVVSFSEDGKSWSVGYTLQEARSVNDGAENIEIKTPDDTTKYSYVKVSKKAALGDAATGVIWFDIHHVAFYSEPDNAASTVKASYRETLTPATNVQNLDKFFDYLNRNIAIVWGLGGSRELLMTAKLEHPTVISDLYLSYELSRSHHTIIEGSVDGVEWIQLERAGGFVGGSGNDAAKTVVHLHVKDTTAYKYIRIVREQSSSYGSWQAYSLGIVGVVVPDAPVCADGFQIADDGEGKYALRVVVEADKIDGGGTANEYGLRLGCAAENGKSWKFTKKTDTLLDSITAKKNGSETEITAESRGCLGFYTAVIENIPKNIGYFSVSVTPYVVIDGNMTVGETKMIVMENDTIVSVDTLTLKDNSDKIKVSGRSLELSSGIACDFSASGIEFNVLAAGNITLKAECSAEIYYSVYVDGILQERLKMTAGTGEYVIARNLDSGKHNIKLLKQSHVAHGTSTLLSIDMKGEFVDRPQDRELLIEFVGDSITCGYGVLNYPTAGVSYYGTAYYADATQAYAYKTAELLDADSSMISVSGWTLISGESSVPAIYDYTSYARSTEVKYSPSRTADVVVINLGTNDVGQDINNTEYATKFIPEAKAFAAKVKAMNPDATIVFAYGMMMSGDTLTTFEADIQTIVRDLGASSAGVYAVKLPTNQAAGNGHPSIEGHTEAAKILADFIKKNCL